jgi:putative iron-only hydrogenase system regulator
MEDFMAETRVAVVAIIVEKMDVASEVNAVLHEFGEYIIGRMGLPYRERSISIINVVLDAPMDKINTLAGKLGRLEGVTAKTVCSAV